MTRLRVLVLHRMGDPLAWREAVRSLEYMIPECLTDAQAVVHDAALPFPNYLKEVDFHLIVLGPTFLGARQNSRVHGQLLEEYSFVRESAACKVALPQDDYDCSAILDDWMVDWKVDRIYTVCPEHWDVLYPRASRQLELRLGYTGYIADSWVDSWARPRAHVERTVDVSYRASKLQANFGRLGLLKSAIAERFRAAILRVASPRLDISVDPRDLIPGSAWHSFVENSRFCLATPSGSSLLDPRNEIRNRVVEFGYRFPDASFEEVERACFPGLDGQYMFSALSPRNIEAALAHTVQIATPGSYSGLFRPIEHYIPLDEDCSNAADVWSMMNDVRLVEEMKGRAKDAVLSEPRLRRHAIVCEIRDFASGVAARRHIVDGDGETFRRVIDRYHQEMAIVSNRHWRARRLEASLRASLRRFGGQRVLNLLRRLKQATSP